MKKLVISFLLFTGLMLPAPLASAAFDPTDPACQGEAANSPICKADGEDPITGEQGIIIRVIQMLSYITGAAAVIIIIFAGIKFVLAGGDPNSIKTARNAVLYALIGLMVFAISQGIVRLMIALV